jgi:hypothetical protein
MPYRKRETLGWKRKSITVIHPRGRKRIRSKRKEGWNQPCQLLHPTTLEPLGLSRVDKESQLRRGIQGHPAALACSLRREDFKHSASTAKLGQLKGH